MNYKQALAASKLGLKIKLPHFTMIKFISHIDDDDKITYELADGVTRSMYIREAWKDLTTWEIYHEPETTVSDAPSGG